MSCVRTGDIETGKTSKKEKEYFTGYYTGAPHL